jgi:hypothetical protein
LELIPSLDFLEFLATRLPEASKPQRLVACIEHVVASLSNGRSDRDALF